MLASYLLSRTLVPVMVDYLLPAELQHMATARAAAGSAACTPAFERRFEQFRDAYVALLRVEPAASRGACSRSSRLVVASGLVLLPCVGQDFFPTVDAGQFRLHVRAPGRHAARRDRALLQPRSKRRSARSFPQHEVELVLDNIGLPNRTYAWPSATAPRPAWPTARSSSP